MDVPRYVEFVIVGRLPVPVSFPELGCGDSILGGMTIVGSGGGTTIVVSGDFIKGVSSVGQVSK